MKELRLLLEGVSFDNDIENVHMASVPESFWVNETTTPYNSYNLVGCVKYWRKYSNMLYTLTMTRIKTKLKKLIKKTIVPVHRFSTCSRWCDLAAARLCSHGENCPTRRVPFPSVIFAFLSHHLSPGSYVQFFHQTHLSWTWFSCAEICSKRSKKKWKLSY